MNKVNCEQLLIKWHITPDKRAALNREVHRLMPELTQFEKILQERKRKGEDMSLKKCKDSFNYLYLQDNLMFMQAGVTLANNPIVKSYKLVFGDKFSDNFQRYIEKMLPAAEESQSSSSSSKDHAASVLSFSESSAEQVWIFDQLSLISFFIDITIHFICLRTAISRRQRNSNHHHHHHHHHHRHQRIMLQLRYRCQKSMISRFGSLINFL